jgi:GrpB-like predicted nucleotidyltransferase (UPF0157 family)
MPFQFLSLQGESMVVMKYDNIWKIYFDKIKCLLEKHLTSFVKIEHIGSTAIVGMCAKPIIDIVIVVEDDNEFIKTKEDLKISFGYYHVGDWGIPGREVFKRKDGITDRKMNTSVLDAIKHNLYVCKIGAEELKRYIVFRDYLNKNENEMLEYYKVKQEIIEEYGNNDHETYCKIKEEKCSGFFKEIISKAQMK